MRIIDENKYVDLSEKVTVELSIKELALLTNTLGITSTYERKTSLRHYNAEGILSDEVYLELNMSEENDDLTFKMFEMMRDYVADRGVFNDV